MSSVWKLDCVFRRDMRIQTRYFKIICNLERFHMLSHREKYLKLIYDKRVPFLVYNENYFLTYLSRTTYNVSESSVVDTQIDFLFPCYYLSKTAET